MNNSLPWAGLPGMVSRIRRSGAVYDAQLRIYGKSTELVIQRSQHGPKDRYKCDSDEDRKEIEEAIKKIVAT